MNTDNLSKIRTVIGEVANEQREKGNSKTANLIASAPDMLEVLKQCSKYFINPLNMMGQEDEIMEQIIKAIIKAEGQGEK